MGFRFRHLIVLNVIEAPACVVRSQKDSAAVAAGAGATAMRPAAVEHWKLPGKGVLYPVFKEFENTLVSRLPDQST